jgi:uncharacterized protein with gpF-like domain
MAAYFAKTTQKRTDAAMRFILRKGGISVRFEMGSAAKDVLDATVQENVALIKSIAQQHLTQVQGMVMRSVQSGRDLSSLVSGLEDQFGVSRRRAALIALNQNNRATAMIQRVRQVELGITEIQWTHSGGGKHPRPTHLKAGKDKVKFDPKVGWWDDAVHRYVWPGSEINCRCVGRSVIPGFS